MKKLNKIGSLLLAIGLIGVAMAGCGSSTISKKSEEVNSTVVRVEIHRQGLTPVLLHQLRIRNPLLLGKQLSWMLERWKNGMGMGMLIAR